MPRPSHSSRFNHPNNTGLGVYRSLSFSLCSFLHSPVTSSLLGPNILLNTLFSNTLSLGSSFNVSDQVSHPYKTTGKIIVLLPVPSRRNKIYSLPFSLFILSLIRPSICLQRSVLSWSQLQIYILLLLKALQLQGSFGLLNEFFPFGPVSDAVPPVCYFRICYVTFYIILPPIFRSS